MQVLLSPLARQPLTEEEFYQLGVETPRFRFAARLFKLLKRPNEGNAQEEKVLEVDNILIDNSDLRVLVINSP